MPAGHPLIDLTGRRFGRLVVVNRDMTAPTKRPAWRVVCDCGQKRTVAGSALRKGLTRSCGCLRAERAQRYRASASKAARNRARILMAMFGSIDSPNGIEGPVSPHANKPVKDWTSAGDALSDLGRCLGDIPLPAGFGRTVKLMNLDAAV
jgi:hypothetical protein